MTSSITDKLSSLNQEDRLSRRQLIKGATAAMGIGAARVLLPDQAFSSSTAEHFPTTPASISDTVAASDSSPIANTSAGRVRGYTRKGIYTFKGIPYGDTTAGENRFMPPKEPKPWMGIRSSMHFGYVCPQPPRSLSAGDETEWLFEHDGGIQGEDCLAINIWTPGLGSQKKRPVMVWLHGGGYYAGSSQELQANDGENLSQRGDVVVASLNHRLGSLGHLDLSRYGEKYRNSGNVGMLDIVAALRWVKENIANFGGDPGLVTIFGQSGGGGKVATLMAMPSAQGLFHRAIIESGSMMRAFPQEQSTQLAEALVKKLGLDASTVDKLQQVPIEKLEAATTAVETKIPNLRSGFRDARIRGSSHPWAPVIDGQVLPEQPFDQHAPAISANVHMLVGTTLNEFVTAINHPEHSKMSRRELLTNVEEIHGEKASLVIETFQKAFPNASPFEIFSVIANAPMRFDALRQANLKAAQGAAPAYCYWFWWQPPVLNGRPMAFHCSEMSFAFFNSDRCENMTGGGPAARALAEKVSDAWIQFARTGDPNHAGLPQWSPVTSGTNATMVFDNECFFRNNLDDEQQQFTRGS